MGWVPYAAILMDCQMPVVNGYEVASEIRRREADGAHIPIVAITASAVKGDEDRCLAAGMDAYLTKPVTIGAVGDALARLIGAPATEPSSAETRGRGRKAGAGARPGRPRHAARPQRRRCRHAARAGADELVELVVAMERALAEVRQALDAELAPAARQGQPVR